MAQCGWSLDQSIHELTHVRSDLATLLQARPRFPRAPPPVPQLKGGGKFQQEVKGGGKKGKGGKQSKGGQGQRWVTEVRKNSCACVFRQVRALFQMTNLPMHVQCHWVTERLVDKLIQHLNTNRCHTDSLSTQQTLRFNRSHHCKIQLSIQFCRTHQELMLPLSWISGRLHNAGLYFTSLHPFTKCGP